MRRSLSPEKQFFQDETGTQEDTPRMSGLPTRARFARSRSVPRKRRREDTGYVLYERGGRVPKASLQNPLGT